MKRTKEKSQEGVKYLEVHYVHYHLLLAHYVHYRSQTTVKCQWFVTFI